jgi:hypothetical protein
MLIDCDTCTVRGEACADCVVTVLLGAPRVGAPPGWAPADPRVVPLRRRTAAAGAVGESGTAAAPDATVHSRHDSPESGNRNSDLRHIDSRGGSVRSAVDLDELEQRAVSALAEFGLVPPIRHQDASTRSGERNRIADQDVS